MNYTEKLNEDLKFGETAEISLNDKLNTYFNCSLTQTPQKHIFDFINKEKKVIIEVKTRKNTKHKYNDTMVGYNKVLEANNLVKEGWDVYFVFNFTDLLTYYHYETENPSWIRQGGRDDRGKKEWKPKYYYVPVIHLINI